MNDTEYLEMSLALYRAEREIDEEFDSQLEFLDDDMVRLLADPI